MKKRGVERPLHVEATKEAAVAKGMALGHANMPSQLFISNFVGSPWEALRYRGRSARFAAGLPRASTPA